MNGTSGATPIVSGVLGLVISENLNLTGAEARQIVEYTTDDIIYGSGTAYGWDSVSGWGRVNAYSAVRLARYLETAPTAPASPLLGDHPILTWNDFGPADSWYVEVRNANTNAVVAGQWFTIAQAGCNLTTCTGQINASLVANIPYKFRVSPYDNTAGRASGLFTPFSGTFTIASPTLTGPTGIVSASYGNPTYTWTGLSGATHYYLAVYNSANQTVVNEVFDAIVACSGLSCSLDPTTLRESNRLTANGTYYYYVRAWSQSTGTGAWSTAGTFTLSTTPPGQPTLNLPSGLGTLRPTFDFTSPAAATYLNVLVTTTTGTTVFDQWFTRTQACGSPTNTVCQSIQSPVNLMDNTQYRYYVRGYGPGGMGAYSSVFTFTVDVPPPATPSSLSLTLQPNGLVQTQWADDANSSWYMVKVSSTTGTVIFNQWMQRTTANLCNAGTCTLLLTNHFPSGATYRLDMQAYGDGGLSALVNGPTLPISVAAPAAVTTGFSPTGGVNTNNDRPTYQWDAVTNASYYNLTSTAAGSGWYRADTICTGGVCRVPLTASLANGSYQWRVQTFGPGGLGPISAAQNFSVGFVGAPAAPSFVSPGTITNPYPTFTWSRDSNVTYYHLLIVSSTSTFKDVWFHVSQICDVSICSIQVLDTAIANGSYSWYMQGYNPAGLGAYNGTTFTVAVTAPAAPSLVTPTTGSILVTNRPTFTWNTSANTSWYNIELINSLGAVTLSQWIQATTCGATCVFQPTGVIPYGIYTWHVRGWNAAGTGSFSSSLLFYALSTNTVPMRIESNDGVMRNPGNWSAIQDASALGGSYAGNAPGTSDWMTLIFDGTGIDVVYIGGPSFGTFNIELDGYLYQTVNSSYADLHYGLALQIQGLAAGEHTLRIIPVNGSSVAIDAFYIAGGFVYGGERPTLEPTAAATEAPTAAPTEAPTEVPTEAPTVAPTDAPTEVPTEAPTEAPTEVPTEVPTETPVP
ncbi:MAG: S8 family serine peptidase [Anaerolineae bacterium]